MSDAPVLVTGAAGFIGRSVVAALASRGMPVRAGLRRTALPPTLSRNPAITAVPCDLAAAATVQAALAGVRAIVHLAYGASSRMPAEMRGLLDEAGRAEVRAVVLFSSVAVYGAREGDIDETAAPDGALDPYGAAKRQCEAMLADWVAAGQGKRRGVILRPGVVYGAGSPFWIDKLLARMKAGAWGTFGPHSDGLAALVHVDDVAEAACRAVDWCLAATDRDDPCVAVNLAGPERMTWNRYFEALAAAAGAGALPAIGSLGLILRQGLGPIAKALRRIGLPAPARWGLAPGFGEMRMFARSPIYRVEKARAVLGWTPTTRLALGLQRSLEPQDTSPRP